MKNLMSVLIFSWLVISCTESKKSKDKTELAHTPVKDLSAKRTEQKTLKQHKLIAELAILKSALENKDSEKLANFFSFPIGDTAINMLDVNAEFDQQRIANNNQMSQDMFINHFYRLYDYWDLNEFSNLFKRLNLKELEDKSKISKDYHVKNDGCYYIYTINIVKDEVVISYGTNSDDAYRQQHPNEEEVCGEYQWTWIFLWDGNHLQFRKQLIAG